MTADNYPTGSLDATQPRPWASAGLCSYGDAVHAWMRHEPEYDLDRQPRLHNISDNRRLWYACEQPERPPDALVKWHYDNCRPCWIKALNQTRLHPDDRHVHALTHRMSTGQWPIPTHADVR